MEDIRKNLIEYRLNSAKEKLRASEVLLESSLYKDSIGRSYYAIFTATRAVLAVDEVDFSKHAGVISYFQKEYIKTGIFDKKYSKILSSSFQIRNRSDYDDMYFASREEAELQFQKAVEFVEEIQRYIDSIL